MAIARSIQENTKECKQAGLVIEKANARMVKLDILDDDKIQRVMLGMPFEKFQRPRYLKYDRERLCVSSRICGGN